MTESKESKKVIERFITSSDLTAKKRVGQDRLISNADLNRQSKKAENKK